MPRVEQTPFFQIRPHGAKQLWRGGMDGQLVGGWIQGVANRRSADERIANIDLGHLTRGHDAVQSLQALRRVPGNRPRIDDASATGPRRR